MNTENSGANQYRPSHELPKPRGSGFGHSMDQPAAPASIPHREFTEEPAPRQAESVPGTSLDPTRRCPEAIRLELEMKARIVGQSQAISEIVGHYQTFLAGLAASGRPICNLLMLGPTGCGKTRIVEALTEALAGDRHALIRIDCGEFQHSHEIAKLIGSPPGYLGHRETHPRLCQEKLDLYHTDQLKISFVLFDEIEKASDTLWNLLLGILDKGTLTLGDNRQVDFSHTMVFMTGNLGTSEAQRLRDLPWGFAVRPDQGSGMFCKAVASGKPDLHEDSGPSQQFVGDLNRGLCAGVLGAASRASQASCLRNDVEVSPHQIPVRQSSERPIKYNAREYRTTENAAQVRSPGLVPATTRTGIGVDPPKPGSTRFTAQTGPGGGRLPILGPSRDRDSAEGENACWNEAVLKQKMEKAVLQAAKRKFAPEFLNRLDRVVLCHALNQHEISEVLDLEINEIVNRIWRHRQCALLVSLSEEARNFLVSEGFDPTCGARYLKRVIEKHIVQPLSSLLATQQLGDGDELVVDLAEEETNLTFSRGVRVPVRNAPQQLSTRWTAAPAAMGSHS